jgi:hypothetical protein
MICKIIDSSKVRMNNLLLFPCIPYLKFTTLIFINNKRKIFIKKFYSSYRIMKRIQHAQPLSQYNKNLHRAALLKMGEQNDLLRSILIKQPAVVYPVSRKKVSQ